MGKKNKNKIDPWRGREAEKRELDDVLDQLEKYGRVKFFRKYDREKKD